VIHPAVRAGFFDRHNVVRFFDNTDDFLIAAGTHAEVARIILSNVAAHRAFADLLFSVSNGIRQPQRIFRRAAQNKEGQPLSSFLSNPGEVLQFIDKSFDRSSKIRHA
jgi:hypothetical protein